MQVTETNLSNLCRKGQAHEGLRIESEGPDRENKTVWAWGVQSPGTNKRVSLAHYPRS